MSDPIQVLVMVGSLRRASLNRQAALAAERLKPEGMTLEFADLSAIPPYNQDVQDQGLPEPVQTLCAQLARADAVLFVSPEYNYSMPGVLKNAIDWASRDPAQPFKGKAAAIMGASPGMLGTARMQYHLRQTLVFLDAHPLNRPEVMIAQANKKFDAAGNLTDETTTKLIRGLLEALADWVRQLKR